MAKALNMMLLALVAAAVPAALATNLCTVPANYFISYDVSGSVDAGEFTTERDFVQNLVIATNVAGSKYFINVFDDKAYTPPVADTFANPGQNVANSVALYARPGSGSTSIGNAIVSLTTRAGQVGVTKGVMVIITDGQNNYGADPIPAANAARAAGLTVVAVGVGNDVSETELKAVAGVTAANNPGIYIAIQSGFSTLPAALDSVIKAACPSVSCISTCTGRTAPQSTCPTTNSWTPCKSCTTNSLVLDYPGASDTCTRCLAAGPDGLDRCFWCVTNALTLKTGKTAQCSCCDKVYNCYNTLENALVNQKGWEQYVLRCKEKFTGADQDKCFWCLTNALTTDPKTCTGDTLNFCAA